MSQPGEDLARDLADGRVVPVVGAGVSRHTAALPDWRGAIQSAAKHAIAAGLAPPEESHAIDAMLTSGALVPAAHRVKELLRAPGPEFGFWLKATFGDRHPPQSTSLINRIWDLQCPLVATTNYDRLLTRVLIDHPEPVTWRQPAEMREALRDGSRVLHLHGVYSEPGSVIWGAGDYDELTSDDAYRTVLRTLWLNRTLLFIGCSFGGLRDPDFTSLLDWAATTFQDSSAKHYALIVDREVTPDLAIDFLMRWRIQVISFEKDRLEHTLRDLNPLADRALRVRVNRIKALIDGTEPDSHRRISELLAGVSSPAATDRPSFEAVATTLLEKEQRTAAQRRGDLEMMQKLAASMLDSEKLNEQIDRFNGGEVLKYAGAFRETVIAASAALAMFPESLLSALKRRHVNIHQNFLEGFCQQVFDDLERNRLVMDPYWLENANRILTSLQAILSADPSSLFPDASSGQLLLTKEGSCLVVVRVDRIELCGLSTPFDVIATLPIAAAGGVVGADVVSFRGSRAICAYDHEQVLIWSPTRAVSPIAVFKVEHAYGISSFGVCHAPALAPLRSVVATIDGPIYELRDLEQVATFTPSNADFLTGLTWVGEWVFALDHGQLPIHRVDLHPHFATPIWLDHQTLLKLLASLPPLKHQIDADLVAKRKTLPADLLEYAEFDKLDVDHPNLWACDILGRHVLALSAKVERTHFILFLDPSSDPPSIVAHYCGPGRTLVGFSIRTGRDGRERLLYARLSDFKETFDLVGWARATPTAHGLAFLEEGSTVRTKDDMIYVTFGDIDDGFASDDSGGLFWFSMRDKSFKELRRDHGAKVRALTILGA